jgi:hypothetical protein
MAKAKPAEIKLAFACGALIWDLWQAAKHKQTCPQCAGRDYLSIALDVAHLVKAA